MKPTDKTNEYDKIIEQKELYEDSKVVREAAVVYGAKKQGEYTIEDYFALPDDERVELIDGVFYNMGAPTAVHQIIGGRIFNKLFNYIESKKGKCVPMTSPIDVQLDRDNKTMVQPDVVIICDRDKFKMGRVFGAPEFVVEVLSPSTSSKDKTIKLSKYMSAGVREYWIVDPKKKNIIVYFKDGEEDYDVYLYSFSDVIPVRLFDSECSVNFKEIYEYTKFLYEMKIFNKK